MTEQSPASERLSSLREQAARLVAEIDQHREECADLLDDSEPATEPARPHGKLWQLLDWSFWGAGMGDVFRMPLADTMLAAVPVETIEQAEEIMAEFIERRKIEKTGVTVYQEQRDELEQLRARVAELEEARRLEWVLPQGQNPHTPRICACGHSHHAHTVPAPHGCFAFGKTCPCTAYRQLPHDEAVAQLERNREAAAGRGRTTPTPAPRP